MPGIIKLDSSHKSVADSLIFMSNEPGAMANGISSTGQDVGERVDLGALGCDLQATTAILLPCVTPRSQNGRPFMPHEIRAFVLAPRQGRLSKPASAQGGSESGASKGTKTCPPPTFFLSSAVARQRDRQCPQ